MFNGQTVKRRLVHIRIGRALFGWTGSGIFALGFTIEKDFCFVCRSYFFFIVLSFPTYTDKGQVLSKFFLTLHCRLSELSSKSMWPIVIFFLSLTRKRFLLRLEWSCKFLPRMFWRRCCRSCTHSVDCKYGQGCCVNCHWMIRSSKFECHILHRMWVHTMNENVRNMLC